MRDEHVKFTLTLDQSAIKTHAADVACLMQDIPNIQQGDTLKISYAIWITYFGNVAEKLSAISRLLKAPGVTCRADLMELYHGHCVIEEVIRELTLLRQRLEQPKSNIIRRALNKLTGGYLFK